MKNADRFKDMLTYADGKPIKCPACLFEKASKDPAFPDKTRAWNLHGRPDDPGSHDSHCQYCDVSWKKQKYELTKEQFFEWAQSEEGKNDLEHWTLFQVEHKMQKGVNGRISAKQWQSCPAAPPVKLRRTDADVKEIVEPAEEWVTEQQYIDKHGRTPKDDGITCEWLQRRSGKKEYGFWKEKDEPVQRIRKRVDTLRFEEELDDGSMQLSDTQVADRYKAEVAASHRDLRSVKEADLAEILKQKACARTEPIATTTATAQA